MAFVSIVRTTVLVYSTRTKVFCHFFQIILNSFLTQIQSLSLWDLLPWPVKEPKKWFHKVTSSWHHQPMPQNARFGVQNVFCMNEMCWQSKVGESSLKFLPERKEKFYNTGLVCLQSWALDFVLLEWSTRSPMILHRANLVGSVKSWSIESMYIPCMILNYEWISYMNAL